MSSSVERIESAVDLAIESVDRKIAAAERSFARRFGIGALRAVRLTLTAALWLLLLGYFAFGALLLTARYWVLPKLNEWRPQIEALASEALQAPVTIDRISGSWRAFNPHLALTNVRVSGPGGAETLTLPRVDATLSWTSVLALEPRFASMVFVSPELEVARISDRGFSVAGFVVGTSVSSDDSRAADWLLAQDRIVIHDARVHFRDHRTAREVDLSNFNLMLEQRFGGHRFSLQATPTAAIAAPIDVRGRFRHPRGERPSDFSRWRGEAYVNLAYADLRALADLFGAPVAVNHADGALRAWLAFDRQRITRLTVDMALQDVDVRLADELEPLQLASVQGRLMHRTLDERSGRRSGEALRLQGLFFATADGRLEQLDAAMTRWPATATEPMRTAVESARIDLTSLAAFAAHVPLAKDLRDAIGRHAIRGTLTDLAAEWNGEAPELEELSLKTNFSGLASAAQPRSGNEVHAVPGLPGFENLSGSVEVARGAGTLQLSSSNAVLVFPGVFAEPRLPFEQLALTARWRWQPALEVRIENARVVAADAEASASGWYRATDSGPGFVDLSGRLVSGDATAAHRYVPLQAGRDTIDWVRHALVAGRVSDGTFRLKGDLRRFPYRQGDGEFRMALRVSGGVLDVAPEPAAATAESLPPPGAVWPLLSGIDAEVVFERVGLTVTAQRAEAMGTRIGATVATIADLANDATLDVRGQASGPLAEMLRYANASPVVRWTNGITRAEAAGPARLDLRLRIPLHHASDSTVVGALHFLDNDLTLRDVPPFSRAAGVLHFSERGVRASGITAQFVGGATRIDASTRNDGALVFSANGTATPAGLRPVVAVEPAQRLLDRSQGAARYQAHLVVDKAVELRVESDLAGLAIDGVAPLRKTAADVLPLRLAIVPAGQRDEIQVDVGSALAVRVEREFRSNQPRIVRGVVALNEPPNLPDQGFLLLAGGPRLDADAWNTLLFAAPSSPAASAPTARALQLDAIAVRSAELRVFGRTFKNVTLGATRTEGGGYDANVVSDDAVGFIAWRPARAGEPNAGRVEARLARLVIAPHRKEDVLAAMKSPLQDIPAMQLSVDQFEFGEMKLGRLDLTAANVASPTGVTWRLHNLAISNPDLSIEANGEWAAAASPAAPRRTQMRFKLGLSDAGASLTRLGYPAAMSRGRGSLEGDIEWLGSPLDLDLPTLGGTVQLAIDQGRFAKVDAGNAGRLLTLLSLQSLSRTLALDGGRQFADGFAFNTVRADATITRGVITTENFRIHGQNAAVLMSGKVDLRSETQQLHLLVLPEIDASTAALALGVANPVLGLGAFVAQFVLRDPLSKIFALEYDVSGSWTDPKVIRRRRMTANAAEQTR